MSLPGIKYSDDAHGTVMCEERASKTGRDETSTMTSTGDVMRRGSSKDLSGTRDSGLDSDYGTSPMLSTPTDTVSVSSKQLSDGSCCTLTPDDDTPDMVAQTDMDPGSRYLDDGVIFPKEKHRLPLDRGWAWIILLVATIEFSIVIGYMKCFGIFFVEWQERFQSSASATSLVSMLRSISYSIAALFVMTLGMQHMSCRVSVMVGAVVEGCAYLITAFADDIRLVYLSNGVLDGIAIAFVQPAMVTMINTYFEKFRGLANNIACVGVSLGGLAFAPLFTKMFAYYGYRGTFMVAAAILFNVIPCGALLRPIETYTRRKTKGIISENGANASICKDFADESNTCALLEIKTADTYKGDYTKYNQESKTLLSEHGKISYIRTKSTESNNVDSNGSLHNSGNINNATLMVHAGPDFIHASLVDLRASRQDIAQPEAEHDIVTSVDKRDAGIRSCRNVLGHIYRAISSALEFSVLREPLFIYYLSFTGFLCTGHGVVGVFLAPHAKDLGVDNDRIAWMLVVVCIVDLVGKLTIGFISDRAWIRRSTLTAMASALLGLASHLIRFMPSYETLMIYAVVVGLLQGVYFSLYAVIIVDYLSLDKLKPCLGFTALMQGIVAGASYPVAGLLRDITGSYVASYHFLGLLLLLGAAMCGCLPIIQRWDNRRRLQRTQ